MEIAYIKVFTDALETWSLLSDEEVGRLVRALLEYQRTGQYPVLPGNERFLFHTCKAQIDRDNEKYRETVSSRASAGKKGAESRWQRQNKDGKNSKCHICHDENGKHGKDEEEDKDKDKDEDKDKDNITPHIPPTEPKVQWAEYVSMTNAEHQKLLDTHGPVDTARLIEILDNYKGSSGKKYKSDYRAILSWVEDRLEEEKNRQPSSSNPFLDMLEEAGL